MNLRLSIASSCSWMADEHNCSRASRLHLLSHLFGTPKHVLNIVQMISWLRSSWSNSDVTLKRKSLSVSWKNWQNANFASI